MVSPLKLAEDHQLSLHRESESQIVFYPNFLDSITQTLMKDKELQYYKNNINNLHSILWESENKRGYIHGFTSNYIKVRQFFFKANLNGTF